MNRGGGAPEISGWWCEGKTSGQAIRMPARGHSIRRCSRVLGSAAMSPGDGLFPMSSDQAGGREVRFIL